MTKLINQYFTISKLKSLTSYFILVSIFIVLYTIYTTNVYKFNILELNLAEFITKDNSKLLFLPVLAISEELEYRYWLKENNNFFVLKFYSFLLTVYSVLNILYFYFNFYFLKSILFLYNFDTYSTKSSIVEVSVYNEHWTSYFRNLLTPIIYLIILLPLMNYFKNIFSRFDYNKNLPFLIIFTTIIFTFSHGDVMLNTTRSGLFSRIITLLLFGIIFAILRLRISFMAACLFHIISNMFAVLLASLNATDSKNQFFILVLIGLQIFYIVLYYIIIWNKEKEIKVFN